jgi:hypothetical protein
MVSERIEVGEIEKTNVGIVVVVLSDIQSQPGYRSVLSAFGGSFAYMPASRRLST